MRAGVLILFLIFTASLSLENEFCQDTIPLRNSTRRLPKRGYLACCNFTLMRGPSLTNSIKTFLHRGGRLVDTAQLYGNEYEVGLAIRESGVPREEIWLSSKINVLAYSPDKGSAKDWIVAQVDLSLETTGLTYIDSMSLHGGPKQILLEIGTHLSKEDHIDMWKGLIEARRLGKILYTGILEHTRLEAEYLMKIEAPAVSLMWIHPWVPAAQMDMLDWLRDSGVAVMGYGLFNFGFWADESPAAQRKIDAAAEAGKRHDVTWGQFVIRWVQLQGHAFVTGFYHEEYMIEDAACLDFDITSEDEAILKSEENWPCNYTVYCFVQHMMGCPSADEPPESHHVWDPTLDGVVCDKMKRGIYNMIQEDEPWPRYSGIVTPGLCVMIATLLATGVAIVGFHKNAFASKADGSVPLLE